jgi:hypothetical protein
VYVSKKLDSEKGGVQFKDSNTGVKIKQIIEWLNHKLSSYDMLIEEKLQAYGSSVNK